MRKLPRVDRRTALAVRTVPLPIPPVRARDIVGTFAVLASGTFALQAAVCAALGLPVL